MEKGSIYGNPRRGGLCMQICMRMYISYAHTFVCMYMYVRTHVVVDVYVSIYFIYAYVYV